MIEHNGRACNVAPGREMRRNISQLGSDVITLMELQTELLQADLRQWTQTMVKAVVALLVALVLLLASTPILLMSLGYFINESTDLSMAASMIIAAGVAILVAAIFAAVGFWMLKREKSVLSRFRSELKQNIAWLKHVLKSPSEVAPTGAEAVV
jgi:divalent metal cation (Fe/Co/Zn/Cd) transporter